MERRPVAFLSYVRDDDAHDYGGITKLRERLEGEVKVQTGKPFEIFQDRNDIRWGQFWKQRIVESLSEVTFLIPIITPSFFESPACREEFETFLKIENTLGETRLILPIYYVTSDSIEDLSSKDSIAKTVRERNWTDWRELRFKKLEDSDSRLALAKLADGIKKSITALTLVSEAAAEKTNPASLVAAAVSEPISTTPNVFPVVLKRARGDSLNEDELSLYRVYSTDRDETIGAAELAGADADMLELQRIVTKSRDRLRRRQAVLLKSFEVGATDKIAVTLLLDNSGSLRGNPISNAAAWSLIVGEMLERYSIQLEVLGYTTRAWRGGHAREKWLKDGKPKNPGRLNDTRHIIYKSFDEPFSVLPSNCAIMMREGILKENIDGEALLWAHSRIDAQTADHKILFVISDGAPVDDSTLLTNPANYLSRHLFAVAQWIEAQKTVKLCAIGIGYTPPYYQNSEQVDAEHIGVPILTRIASLLKTKE